MNKKQAEDLSKKVKIAVDKMPFKVEEATAIETVKGKAEEHVETMVKKYKLGSSWSLAVIVGSELKKQVTVKNVRGEDNDFFVKVQLPIPKGRSLLISIGEPEA